MRSLKMTLLSGRFGVCRFSPRTSIADLDLAGEFWSVTRTPEELSVVLLEEHVPADCVVELGWRALVVEGPLDFGEIGILASITEPLARGKVSLFAVSTYRTDHVLVQDREVERAISLLERSGHEVAVP